MGSSVWIGHTELSEDVEVVYGFAIGELEVGSWGRTAWNLHNGMLKS